MTAGAIRDSLFGEGELKPMWEEHWWGMPQFTHEDLTPLKQVVVSFATEDEIEEFSGLVNQPITMKTRSIWFKPQAIGVYHDKSYE